MASLALAFDLLARDKNVTRTFDQVGDSADRTGGKIGGLGSKFAGLGKAVALGVGALAVGGVALGKSFVDAAVESQKITKQTEAVIKSMGNVAGVSADQVAKLSESLSMQTGVDDELIQAGQNVLLTFGNVRNAVGKGPKVFDRATKAALDMSVALGTDMSAASMMVGKALNDPIAGISKLSRSGIQFTDQQKDQIRIMQEAGDVAGAQAIMLAELERQFGGSAEAQATAGDRLKVVWGNLQEEIGGKLLPIFERLATWLTDVLPVVLDFAGGVWETIRPTVEDAGAAIGDFVSGVLTALSDWWSNNGDSITGWFSDVGSAIGDAVADGFDALSTWWSNNGDNIKTWFSNMGTVLSEDVAPALAAVGGYLKDDVYPWLKTVGEWIVDNEFVWDNLKLGVLAAAGAWAVYAVAAGAAATATGLAAAPYLAMIGLVVGLSAVTDWLIERYNVGLSQALQQVVDIGAGVVGFFKKLAGWIWDAVNAAKELIGLLPNVHLPGGGAASGLIPNIPILGPLNPGEGVPFVPFMDDGGIMPGQRGVHSLAYVAGGETVIPTHKPGFQAFDAVGEDQLLALREQNGLLRGILGAVTSGTGLRSLQLELA